MTKAFYTRIGSIDQIASLEGKVLKDGLEYYFAMFFKSNLCEGDWLLRRGKCVIYLRNGLVSTGNYECITNEFDEMKYTEFVDYILST